MKIQRIFKLYDKYNEAYFAGKLDPVDIAVVDLRDAFGYTIQEGKEVSVILIAKGMKNSQVRSTLLHEMIHVDQVRQGHKMDHGRKFNMMAKIICNAEKISYRAF